jgi:hypothetical protein
MTVLLWLLMMAIFELELGSISGTLARETPQDWH